jgi:hypothetical protein
VTHNTQHSTALRNFYLLVYLLVGGQPSGDICSTSKENRCLERRVCHLFFLHHCDEAQ